MSDGTERHRQDAVDGIEYSIYHLGVRVVSTLVMSTKVDLIYLCSLQLKSKLRSPKTIPFSLSLHNLEKMGLFVGKKHHVCPENAEGTCQMGNDWDESPS